MMPFFKYFGSKYTLSAKYPAPVGTVCEPFAGSAAYSVRHNVRDAVLIDKDERVCELWEYLIGVSSAEILSLPDIPAGGRVSEQKWPCNGARLLVSCWVNTSPFRDMLSEYRHAFRHPDKVALWWGSLGKQRIASQLDGIRRWRVIQGDYTQAPDTETTFVDPPYQVQGAGYKHGPKSIDFAALGQWCMARQGLVIACEQAGADWLPWNVDLPGSRRAPGCKTGEIMGNHEVAWVSGHGSQGTLF